MLKKLTLPEILILIGIAGILVAIMITKTTPTSCWKVEKQPETAEEAACVYEKEKEYYKGDLGKKLFDQGYSAVYTQEKIHEAACAVCCPSRRYFYENGEKTGQVEEVELLK